MSTSPIPTLETFLNASTEEVVEYVKKSGEHVCVFPPNGTRRWFTLEAADLMTGSCDPVDYLSISVTKQMDMCKLIFDHGVTTLLVPVFGYELLTRGDEYTNKNLIKGISYMFSSSQFHDFCRESEVKVSFYGNYEDYFNKNGHSNLVKVLDNAKNSTNGYTKNRLFFGMFADDATDATAKNSIKFFQETGKVPTKQDLVKMYYGEFVKDADIFIGFAKFNVFDYPLLSSGREELYFSLSPSPYMTKKQIRKILYDYMYLRKVEDPDYGELSTEQLGKIRSFYLNNCDNVLGMGEIKDEIWFNV